MLERQVHRDGVIRVRPGPVQQLEGQLDQRSTLARSRGAEHEQPVAARSTDLVQDGQQTGFRHAAVVGASARRKQDIGRPAYHVRPRPESQWHPEDAVVLHRLAQEVAVDLQQFGQEPGSLLHVPFARACSRGRTGVRRPVLRNREVGSGRQHVGDVPQQVVEPLSEPVTTDRNGIEVEDAGHRRGELVRCGKRRAVEQQGDDAQAAGEARLDLDPHRVGGVGEAGRPVRAARPSRADEHQHHLGLGDRRTDDVHEGKPGPYGVDVEKYAIVPELRDKVVVQPTGRPTRLDPAVADEHVVGPRVPDSGGRRERHGIPVAERGYGLDATGRSSESTSSGRAMRRCW